MELPEEYNVVHIGPELSSVDRVLMSQAKRSKLVSMSAFISVGVMLFGLIFVNASLHTSLDEQQKQITSLIDEVGTLNQTNFELSEQVTSQETVLQGIATDFTSLGEALNKGDNKGVQDVLASILSRVPTESTLSLAGESTTQDVEDKTFDILVLGTNGSHTDTIIVASINEEKKKISLFSIPRDLYINGRRINEYYTYYGVEQLGRMVTEVTGLVMDKYVQVDLAGFEDIVDILGGLDIYVPESIYDGLYPNGKGGYMAYSIEEGQYHMTGEEALRYARSRKSTSDFDRAERQQAILSALKTKLVQFDSVMEMKELTQLFQTVMSSTTTDIDLLDAVGYYYDYQSYDMNTGFVLTSGNYLYSMINQSGAYILLPDVADFSEVHQVISDLVN